MRDAYKAHRGDADNTIDVKRTYTLLIDLEEIDPKYDDDEVTLQSDDDEYKQTLVLGRDGEMVDERWMKLTFTKVLPGKTYTCLHDLKQTSAGRTGTLVLFRSTPIEDVHLNKPNLLCESLAESEKEEERREVVDGVPGNDEVFGLWPQIGEAAEEGDEDDGGESARDESDLEDEDLWLREGGQEDGWNPQEQAGKVRAEEEQYFSEEGNAAGSA